VNIFINPSDKHPVCLNVHKMTGAKSEKNKIFSHVLRPEIKR